MAGHGRALGSCALRVEESERRSSPLRSKSPVSRRHSRPPSPSTFPATDSLAKRPSSGALRGLRAPSLAKTRPPTGATPPGMEEAPGRLLPRGFADVPRCSQAGRLTQSGRRRQTAVQVLLRIAEACHRRQRASFRRLLDGVLPWFHGSQMWMTCGPRYAWTFMREAEQRPVLLGRR